MIAAAVPPLALSNLVEVSVAVVCIAMAGGVVVAGIARRREGFDAMLVVSAVVVVALAVVILLNL